MPRTHYRPAKAPNITPEELLAIQTRTKEVYPKEIEWLFTPPKGPNATHTLSDFMISLRTRFETHGTLTDAQMSVCTKAVRASEAREKTNEVRKNLLLEAPPAPEGELEITGTIISAKQKVTPQWTGLKMIVELPDLNRVWMTVPSQLQRDVEALGGTYPGTIITVIADFIRSRDDQHFSFGKRPRLVSIN